MTRIALFLATNFAIILVAGVIFQLLGVESTLAANGVDLDLRALLIISLVYGMLGSGISLAMSKWSAKRMMGVHVIEQPQGSREQWLVQKVSQHAQAAGIGMPEVGIFDSPTPNAFATGARRDHALVAVSTGLLRGMNEDEVDAVLGHEIAHVANGDMVTLALISGVVNAFVIFLSRVVGHVVDRMLQGQNEESRGHGPGYFIVSILAQIVFSFLASMIVSWFSRQREFRADAGGARLAGRENMIAALQRLKSGVEAADPLPDQMQAFGIFGLGGGGLRALFSTHPPLEERIARLRSGT